MNKVGIALCSFFILVIIFISGCTGYDNSGYENFKPYTVNISVSPGQRYGLWDPESSRLYIDRISWVGPPKEQSEFIEKSEKELFPVVNDSLSSIFIIEENNESSDFFNEHFRVTSAKLYPFYFKDPPRLYNMKAMGLWVEYYFYFDWFNTTDHKTDFPESTGSFTGPIYLFVEVFEFVNGTTFVKLEQPMPFNVVKGPSDSFIGYFLAFEKGISSIITKERFMEIANEKLLELGVTNWSGPSQSSFYIKIENDTMILIAGISDHGKLYNDMCMVDGSRTRNNKCFDYTFCEINLVTEEVTCEEKPACCFYTM